MAAPPASRKTEPAAASSPSKAKRWISAVSPSSRAIASPTCGGGRAAACPSTAPSIRPRRSASIAAEKRRCSRLFTTPDPSAASPTANMAPA